MVETPGHTPEHVSYVAIDTSRGAEPVGVFCGDTLFVGDVGRPDLFPGKAEQLARALYSSLHDKLMKLPDFCEVLPAHGAGSLCGRAMGAKWRSTIGYERLYNSALQVTERMQVCHVSHDRYAPRAGPLRPLQHDQREGPALVQLTAGAEGDDPGCSSPEKAARKDTVVLDIRPYAAFGGQHIAGAYHIDFGGNFPTFAGWIIPPDKDVLLVVPEAVQVTGGVGLAAASRVDRVSGVLVGSMYSWAAAGLPTATCASSRPQKCTRC